MGIALDLKNDYLYYHALTAHTLYRIKTQYLKDVNLSNTILNRKLKTWGGHPRPMG
jgi:hypothetical protein